MTRDDWWWLSCLAAALALLLAGFGCEPATAEMARPPQEEKG